MEKEPIQEGLELQKWDEALMGPIRDFATAVVVCSPEGIIMVREYKPNRLAYLKFPGGRRDGDEDPAAGAARELEEETGVVVDPSLLVLLKAENRGKHDFFLFGVCVPALNNLKRMGDEGEAVGVYSPEGLKLRRDIFPKHWIKEAVEFIYNPPEKAEACLA